jgi:hypothetical protein
MVGVGALVTSVAPLAGGVLLGGMAGKSGPSVPDFRAIILSDLELLQRIPEDEVARRAALKRMIGEHVEALLVAQEKSREFKRKTRYFTEHWRDIVLFVTSLLFVVIIWHADHHRPVWLPLLIATIVMSVVTAISVVRRALTTTWRESTVNCGAGDSPHRQT